MSSFKELLEGLDPLVEVRLRLNLARVNSLAFAKFFSVVEFHSVSDIINRAFFWPDSKEGKRYWEDIYYEAEGN